jgi:hypothetical protein
LRKTSSLVSLAAIAGLALAACGGGKDADDAPKPRESLAKFAARVQAALTQPKCPGLQQINADAQFILPCPSTARDPRARQAFANFRVTGSREYRTGGVIDFTDAEAPRGGTYVVALGKDRRWVILSAPKFDQAIAKTKPRNQGDFEKALDRFLPAVEKRRCDEFFKYSFTQSQNKQVACRQELGRAYEPLRRALRASGDAEPFLLGGNREILFFGLLTDKPNEQYRTIPVIRAGQDTTTPYLVLTTSRV